jgi:hypothetical protein
MSLTSMLESAQGGALFANVAKAAGLAEGETRAAMGKLCPAIAGQLKAKAESDEDIYDSLLDLLEDNDGGGDLEDAQALTDAEALADGNAVLEDVYGSRNEAIATFRNLVPNISEGSLSKLAAISATAVLSAIAQGRNAAQPLTGASPAAGAGGGLLSVILGALFKGLMQGAQRSLAPRRRRRSYGSYYSRRRTRRSTTRRRTRRTPLDDIFGEILGTRRR